MSKTLYDVIGVAKNASQELIDLAFQTERNKLIPLIDTGDIDAKNKFNALKEAFGILSDENKRISYDQSLQKNLEDQSNFNHSFHPKNEPNSRRGIYIFAITAAIAFSAFLLHQFNERENATIALKKAEQEAKALAEQLRIQNERALIQGTVSNQTTTIEKEYSTQNRRVGIQERAEDRYSRQLEYENSAANRVLDIENQRAETYARQVEIQEKYRKELADATHRREQEAKAARERRYWACMNEALNRMASSQANARCIGYR